jgi:8-oxo-dGTP pyrophosphatase MutT (NUDIX family)
MKDPTQRIGPWTVVARRGVYANPWIEVTHQDVLTPHGQPGVYGTVHFKHRAIGVLPLSEDGHTWLVGQHRFPLDTYFWEIPEGGAAPGEDPLAAARRELREETGLTAEKWEKVLELHLSNSVTDEHAVAYVARGLTPGPPEPDATEALAVRKVPFAEVYAMVLRGEITDALSVATILRVQLLLLGQ